MKVLNLAMLCFIAMWGAIEIGNVFWMIAVPLLGLFLLGALFDD